MQISMKLPSLWASGDINQKENLQKLVFPNGVTYDRKNGAFRTEKVNEVFRCIAAMNSVSGQNKTGQNGMETNLSSLVGMARFELATSWSQTRRDNRATLHPELKNI